VAHGITCLAYGVAEMAKGYGFLAVFVAALALRSAERGSDYHQKLHDFAEELERLLMMVLLVLLGGAITGGGLFRALTWQGVAFALIALFVVRPLSGWIGLAGTGCPPAERAVVSFFGIRGLGSVYYLAFALQAAAFEAPDLLWSTMGLTIVISIVLHGMTVTPVMRRLDAASRSDRRAPPRQRPAYSAASGSSPVSRSALARSRIRARSVRNSP
jgi:NhaP-type Na+/H+ or K+/H+ antiporter